MSHIESLEDLIAVVETAEQRLDAGEEKARRAGDLLVRAENLREEAKARQKEMEEQVAAGEMLLIKFEKTGEVAVKDGDFAHTFGSTTLHLDPDREYEVIGEVPSLRAWRIDPGRYGPHHAVAQVRLEDQVRITNRLFYAGGHITYIRSWCEEHDAELTSNVSIVDGRNRARRLARELGGVEW